jgi:hypothetical protein
MLGLVRLPSKAERSEWGENPYTLELRRQMVKSLRPTALQELLGVCEKSSDPRVTAKCAEYKALDEIIDFLEKSGREQNE